MNLQQRTILVLSFFVSFIGCEEPFSSNAPFAEELVVYSILSNVSDRQYVRLYRTYDASTFDPFEHLSDNGIQGAAVSVSFDQQQIFFRDTVVARKDTTRYKDSIKTYVADPIVIQRGKTYVLDVLTADNKSIHTPLKVPEISFLQVTNPALVRQPSGSDKFIVVRVTVPSTAKGFLLRLILQFDVFQNGSWIPQSSEVPYEVFLRGEDQIEIFRFPKLDRSPEPVGGYSTISYFFSIDAYQKWVSKQRGEAGGPVRFNSADFILSSVEENLYNYYNIVQGFRDPNTIRVDEPDYSSFPNAAGIFGAFIQDTVSIALPPGL